MTDAMPRDIKLPEISEGDETTIITKWHVSSGGQIAKGVDMVEVSTDKATFDVPFPCDGVVVSIEKKEGDAVSAGETIVKIREGAIEK